jgi:inorganic pyrophosphatase
MNIWHDVSEERISKEKFIGVIEISKGCKNKYELDKETGRLRLDRVLYTATHYPANYGFIPKTYSGDNDPLDVLVLCQETLEPMSLVKCRPIGVVLMIDGGEVDDKALNLLVMQEIALAGTDIGIVQGLVNLHRFGLDVLSVLVVKSLLGNFTNVDFGIEVGGECLVMVSGIAVHNVQIVDFIEVVLCDISGKHTGHTGVETASQNGAKASLLEAFTVGPLPAVFEMSLILRLIVGGIQIDATGLQTSFHNGEILIW